MSILTGFNVKKKPFGIFENTGIKATFNIGMNVYEMWENQKDIFLHRGEKFVKIIQPCGAGKSVSIQYIATHNLLMDPKLRVVIAVPQNIIKKTFKKCKLQFPNEPIYTQSDKIYDWDINNNLCDDTRGSKIQEIAKFLKKDHYGNNRAERIAIISHSALARLYSAGLIESCENTMFFIDEAHHIMYSECGVSETSNMIGQFVQWIVEEDNPTCKLWLTTATFFRSDKYSIIPPEIMNKFVEYVLPYDEYWEKYIKYIKSFSYDFVIYQDRDVFTEVKEIVRLFGRQKTIVFCPYIGHLVEGIGKLGFLKLLKEAFLEVWPECRILDLVTEEDRKSRKEDFIEGNTEYDVALAVRLFDEGSDWVHASCAIDLAPSDSLRIQQQRFGRIGRDHESKSHIHYFSFLPFKSTFKDNDERRKHLSNSWNALIASSLLNEMIEPIPYPVSSKKEEKDEKGIIDNNVKLENPLKTVFPDDIRKQEIIEDVVRNLVVLKNINENPTIEETQKCIMSTLRDNGIEEQDLENASVYIAKLLRKSVQSINVKPDWENQTVDVSWMSEDGFDKIWPNDMYDKILSFTSGVCNVNTFKEFRTVYGERTFLNEMVIIAKELEKKYGIVPNHQWLKNNHLIRLSVAMLTYPETFKDIKQIKLKCKIDVYVEIAEELDKIFPEDISYNYVKEMGFRSIYEIAKKNQDIFSHIKWCKNICFRNKQTDIKSWVMKAENIEKILGYVPASSRELSKFNCEELCRVMITKPEYFLHINKYSEIAQVPFEESKLVIDALVKKFGFIPSNKYLKENDLEYVTRAIQSHKEIFKNYKRDFKRKVLSDHEKVIEIKSMAKNNGGTIPNSLQSNSSLSVLYSFFLKNMNLFSGLKYYCYNKIITIGEQDGTPPSC